MSVMSITKYSLYCQKFGLIEAITSTLEGSVTGIAGRQQAIGTDMMQIPFKGLGVVIWVVFLLLSGNVQSLFCITYLYWNGLGISIQSCKVMFQGRVKRNGN